MTNSAVIAHDLPERASELVIAAKSGDQRALTSLYRLFRPRIFALALHLTGNKADAEDITQDAFLRAFSRIQEFEGRSEFFTWLYRIALHRALNVKRNAKKRPAVDYEDPRIEAAMSVDSQGNPRKDLERRDFYAQLLAAFDSLAPVQRTTVALHALQGMSHKEIAVVLGVAEGTISWRIHEARKVMRKHMSESAATRSHEEHQHGEEIWSVLSAAAASVVAIQ